MADKAVKKESKTIAILEKISPDIIIYIFAILFVVVGGFLMFM